MRSLTPQPGATVHTLARAAVRALYAEVALEPKPGLVSFRDNGSHTDMTAHTFVKSLFTLRHYFRDVAQAGWEGQPFAVLQALGVAAEARMLRATHGINTHRGAIFSLGLLCAAGGWLLAQGQPMSADRVRQALRSQWGAALQQRAAQARLRPAISHGQRVAQCFQLRSAHEEAAAGFPTLFDVTWPALQMAWAQGLPARAAKVQSLLATMAHLDDTNLAHRGGLQAMRMVQARAAELIAAGGVAQPDWVTQVRHLHAALVAQRLSPGGAADLLACACWLHALHTAPAKSACATTPAGTWGAG